MTIQEYKTKLKQKLLARTVVFLVKDNKVLLGFKKTGFGKGYYVGIGGKVEAAESLQDAAIREVKEEINVAVKKLTEVGILSFYFPHKQDESWNQHVYAFLVTEWKGDPIESDEIKPDWFDIHNLPLDKMWDDAKYWLPQILEGRFVKNDYVFDENLKVINCL